MHLHFACQAQVSRYGYLAKSFMGPRPHEICITTESEDRRMMPFSNGIAADQLVSAAWRKSKLGHPSVPDRG